MEQPKLTQQDDPQGRAGSLGPNQHSSRQGSQQLAAPTETPSASFHSLIIRSELDNPSPHKRCPSRGCAARRALVPPAALRGGSPWHPTHPGRSHLSRQVWGSAANPLHILAGCGFLGREKSVSDGQSGQQKLRLQPSCLPRSYIALELEPRQPRVQCRPPCCSWPQPRQLLDCFLLSKLKRREEKCGFSGVRSGN